MGLESAEFIDGLVTTNPLSTDLKTQGDDHLRLIKAVLQNTFPRASKAYPFPDTIEVNNDYDILADDQNMIIEAEPGGGPLTLTPPSLSNGDAGWWVFVTRTGSGNGPILIVPSSGQVNGFDAIRRSVNSELSLLIWTGNQWICTRPAGMPIGTVIQFPAGFTVPNNFLVTNGNNFDTAEYPELAVVLNDNNVPNISARHILVE